MPDNGLELKACAYHPWGNYGYTDDKHSNPAPHRKDRATDDHADNHRIADYRDILDDMGRGL